MAVQLGINESVDWGPLSTWIGALATTAAVLVALFVNVLAPWHRQPVLRIAFEPAEPYCRFTRLADGTIAYWVSVLVQNVGRTGASRCIGKFVDAQRNGERRVDRDPMQLRWRGVPDQRGFDPIDLAIQQGEFLNVFRIIRGDPSLRFETFPGYAPGFPTALEPAVRHFVRVVAAANDALPAAIWLSVEYTGDFETLPNSLVIEILLDRRAHRRRKDRPLTISQYPAPPTKLTLRAPRT